MVVLTILISEGKRSRSLRDDLAAVILRGSYVASAFVNVASSLVSSERYRDGCYLHLMPDCKGRHIVGVLVVVAFAAD